VEDPVTVNLPGTDQGKGTRGAIAAFCLYDVADSAFATTILAVLFNKYFAQQVAGGPTGVRLLGAMIPGATLYSWLVSITMLLVAIAAPPIGALVDATGRRMATLRALTVAGAVSTVLLATVGPGAWVRGSVLFGIAYAAFALASVIYNSLLPGLVENERLGRISGLAWGLGYLGGGFVLGLNLVMLRSPASFGLADTQAALRASFALAGVWWIALALPLLVRREPFAPRAGGSTGVGRALRQALATLRGLRGSPHFLRYLIAYLLYNDSIQTIVAVASIFAAAELGFADTELVLLFLLIQATGFLGALFAGRIADRVGHKGTILVQIAAFFLLTVWARWTGIFGAPRLEFWWIGASAGLFLGGIQTVSRSLLARWIPSHRSAEIFGFFSVAGRFASVLGPAVFGAIGWMAGGLRPAILSVSLFFLAGGVILWTVDEKKGERELHE
jgi:UMF1 family MFS transporter